MVVRIVLDDREAALHRAVTERAAGRDDVAVQDTRERLDLGDALIVGDAATIVVERKAVADLMSSLYDGRLAEQGERLRTWQAEQPPGAAYVVLVVEGAPSAGLAPERYRHFVKTHLQLVLASSPADGRMVLRTESVGETAALLLTLHKTIVQGGVAAAAGVVMCGAMPRKQHSAVIVRQLSCTQGMSVQRARRVQAEFPSLRLLCEAMRDRPQDTLTHLAALVGSGCVARRLWTDLLGEEAPAPPAKKRRRIRAAAAQDA